MTMTGQCKSCLSPNHNLIDERLIKGESCESLSEWLRGQDEMISPPSILRHRKNHVVGMKLESNTTGSFLGDSKNPPKNAGDDDTNEMFIDTSAVLARIANETADTNIFTSVFEARKFTQLLMERIVQNQLVIVHELQQQYSAGKAGYPDSQIRGLKTILDITNALPTYADKQLLRKMKDSNDGAYAEKVKQHAYQIADDLNKRFVDNWEYVLSPERVPTYPYDVIEEYSEIVYQNDGAGRKAWRISMGEYWTTSFTFKINELIDFERDIKDVIENHWYDDGDTAFKDQYQLIVAAIMGKFKTPESAIDNQDDLELVIKSVVETFEAVEEV
jgi:hypothetical protein